MALAQAARVVPDQSQIACRSQPLEEYVLHMEAGKEVECLIDAIKAQMSAGRAEPSEAEKAARRQALLAQMPKGTEVPDDLLNLAGAPFSCSKHGHPTRHRRCGGSGLRALVSAGFTRSQTCFHSAEVV